ncbi:MAG: DUF47 family protein, partial [Solirubrobacteraceae bacterium]
NGFHDTANVVATSISTRAMSPRLAVGYAALLNFAGAFISIAVAATIAQAMPRLREFRDISHFTIEIHRLENDGDRVVREAIAALFHNGIDPMVVIRWKDIYERLENAIDSTERVANILEGIVIKNR